MLDGLGEARLLVSMFPKCADVESCLKLEDEERLILSILRAFR